ncbi:DnaJ protein subfamily C member 8 [Pelomyxa schiedti]|nr:DnaJ protein subfamily C member 8 [Pelomyxa schiedti]
MSNTTTTSSSSASPSPADDFSTSSASSTSAATTTACSTTTSSSSTTTSSSTSKSSAPTGGPVGDDPAASSTATSTTTTSTSTTTSSSSSSAAAAPAETADSAAAPPEDAAAAGAGGGIDVVAEAMAAVRESMGGGGGGEGEGEGGDGGSAGVHHAKRTAEETDKLIRKILFFKNPYDQLESTPEMALNEIRSHYKRLTLIVHPDKCAHPRSGEAIAALSKAIKICENPTQRLPFIEVTEKSREKVNADWKSQGLERTPENEEAYLYDLRRETHAMIIDIEARLQKADEMQRANDKRVKEERQKLQEQIKQQEEQEKKWEERRSERVASWREFVTKKGGGPKSKKPKVTTTGKPIKPPKVRKESR